MADIIDLRKMGSTPEGPVAPEKMDVNCTYAFTGWDKTIVAVAGATTYTAQFSNDCTPRKYTITFDLDNGSDPVEVEVAVGETPAWTGAAPTKEADAQYTYTFTGWDATFVPVTSSSVKVIRILELRRTG